MIRLINDTALRGYTREPPLARFQSIYHRNIDRAIRTWPRMSGGEDIWMALARLIHNPIAPAWSFTQPDYSDLSSEQPAQGQPDCLANRVTPAPAVSASIVGRPDLKLERAAYGAPSLWTIRAPLGNLRLPDKRETFFHPPGWCTCHTSGPNC